MSTADGRFCGLGAILWGYDAQIGTGLLSVPFYRRDFGYQLGVDYVIPARWQSAFNSVSSIGGMFGGLAVGWIADRVGHRGAITIACIISIAAVFMQFFCPPHQNALLLIGKLVNGVALGIYISTAAAYCAEISPTPLRGITTGCVNLWIVVGQFMANCVIQGLGSREDRYAYRIPLGQNQRSKAVLLALGTKEADLHLRQIQATIALEDLYAAETTYWQCFRGTNLRRTIIALMVFVLQQIVGVIFVLGYSTYFFQLAGFKSSDSFKLGVGVTAIGVVGNLTALYSVNRFGRRPLFLWGMIGCTAVNFGIGFSSISNTKAASWVEAIFTLIFGFVYQGSIGPLGYVIFSEISSAKLRSKTVGLGIFVNSLCGMLASIVIPTVDELDALFEAKVSSRKFAETSIVR
ncbi:uncharacterized protein IL334_004114 [Kwoniella shivajii]|uniref:Major facilitator superfamily (MFS) profile domain-containing protein n=1 Tax=Kwoniella shivajii TaxID=564305 RepID=A0ABZ1CZF9_9TREE|nr:hypothetical protein IL334_004114 [Kwoniella shivajii]